jgi:hypothetical protein
VQHYSPKRWNKVIIMHAVITQGYYRLRW